MARFKVKIAHDGLQAGLLFDQPVSPLTDYMVKNGFWEIVPEPVKKPVAKKKASKTTKK